MIRSLAANDSFVGCGDTPAPTRSTQWSRLPQSPRRRNEIHAGFRGGSDGDVAPGAGREARSLPRPGHYGTARTRRETPVIGVTVTLTGPGAAQIASTDSREIPFSEPLPRRVLAHARAAGIRKAHRDVTVALGNAVLSVTLPVAGVTEAVTVSGDAPPSTAARSRLARRSGRGSSRAFPRPGIPGPSWAGSGVLFNNVNVGGGIQGQDPSSSERARIRSEQLQPRRCRDQPGHLAVSTSIRSPTSRSRRAAPTRPSRRPA